PVERSSLALHCTLGQKPFCGGLCHKKNVIHVSAGLITYAKEEFLSRWIGNNATEATKEGIALLLEVTPKFHKLDWEDTDKRLLRFLFQYLFKYKGLLAQLCIGLLW